MIVVGPSTYVIAMAGGVRITTLSWASLDRQHTNGAAIHGACLGSSSIVGLYHAG
jgi:hypothetical protein